MCVGMLFIALVITFSQKQKSRNNCGNFLSEFSLALYVSHWTIRAIVPVVMSEATYKEMLVPYLLISFIYAGGFVVAVNGIQRFHLTKKVKNYFVLQEHK